MEEAATRQHAHPNTVLHCLYGFYVLGYSRKHLAHVYNKCESTIGNWIRVYEATGTYARVPAAISSKFTYEHRAWLLDYYTERPLSYIDEAQAAFKTKFFMDISRTSVWRIVHEHGLTWKVLERRAMHIKEKDVHRFVQELSTIDWCHHNLVFLDEVSFDNRGMIRKRGYAPKGKKLAIRGEFTRKPRVSLLAFLGVDGLLGYYDTEGTFDRATFVRSCRAFAYSDSGNVRQYPGTNSVWIMDGATIHRHPEIVHFLRSIGIVPIFLPAYCPFFNPIEYLFGYVKRAFQRHYDESSSRDLMPFVVKTLRHFEAFDMARVFPHCGWTVRGHFDPTGPMSTEHRRVPDIYDGDDAAQGTALDQELDQDRDQDSDQDGANDGTNATS